MKKKRKENPLHPKRKPQTLSEQMVARATSLPSSLAGQMVIGAMQQFYRAQQPPAEFKERARLFLTELAWLTLKYDVCLFGHDGMGAASMAITDGAKDFNAADIQVFEPGAKR